MPGNMRRRERKWSEIASYCRWPFGRPKRAGDGTRTRDILLGKQNVKSRGKFPEYAQIIYLSSVNPLPLQRLFLNRQTVICYHVIKEKQVMQGVVRASVGESVLCPKRHDSVNESPSSSVVARPQHRGITCWESVSLPCTNKTKLTN